VIVLGVDPGTATVGYGIVEARGAALRDLGHGCITTSSDLPLPERLLRIHDGVADLIARCAPDVVAVERIYFQTNAQTAVAVGHARGVILLAAARAGASVVEATPNEVKQAVTGHGAADKRQVQRMVRTILSLDAEPRPDDAADALAIAIWAAHAVGAPAAAGTAAPAAVLDRAAVNPMAAGPTPYERAVREALAAERRAADGTARPGDGQAGRGGPAAPARGATGTRS
jgi:crossover junction endodeoxyribonuclease RuvC